ncbi:replication protein [Gallibacterium genomosp. 3]|uniref:Replication protein n=1 Tax=Gallibacterium genomosp. 3 TaxID=505345 RepID=A0A1A7PV47_9PAST|nr:replication endonuclease [Gallibacterium genomosp. 3]OBX05914.1 replication protein [Gallibacterium genomosp. 3]
MQYATVRQASDYIKTDRVAPMGLTPVQYELFNCGDDDIFKFGYAKLKGLPDFLSKYFVKRYLKTFRKSGRFTANTWLRTTLDNGVLERVENVLQRHPIIETVKVSESNIQTIDEDGKRINTTKTIALHEFSRHQVVEFAKKIADEMFIIQQDFLDENLHSCKTKEAIDKKVKSLYYKLGRLTELKGITPQFWDKYHKGLITSEQIGISIMKMCDEDWWTRKLWQKRSYLREHLAIAVGQVQAAASPYASREAIAEWRTQKKKNSQFLKTMQLINEEDEEEQLGLDEMFYKTVSNPAIRRCELMNRMRGFEELAKLYGYVGEFYTLTAPSSYHAISSKGGFVKKWNFSNPRDTQDYLCRVFARVRAALKRRNINIFGFRVVEPHHDGTPHWHMLFFMEQKHVETVRAIFAKYALEEDGNEAGANEHRFTAKAIDWEKGSATGYIAKYIAKNIDGYACDDDVDDETGEKLKDGVKNVCAWASKWRIRQFQQIGGAPVTVFRELRRKHGRLVGDQQIDALIQAADDGDWTKYTELQGGAFVSRKDLVARTVYEDRKPNKYGEISKKIIGIFNQLKPIFELIGTRLKKWKLVKKSVLASQQGLVNHSAHSAAWSSVNNCTDQKIDNVGEEINTDEKIDKEQQVQALISRKIDWLLRKKIRLTDEMYNELVRTGSVRVKDGRYLSVDYGELRLSYQRRSEVKLNG